MISRHLENTDFLFSKCAFLKFVLTQSSIKIYRLPVINTWSFTWFIHECTDTDSLVLLKMKSVSHKSLFQVCKLIYTILTGSFLKAGKNSVAGLTNIHSLLRKLLTGSQ